MLGKLFCYDSDKRLCAFETASSQDNDFSKFMVTVIIIGGMGDGLLALPWTDSLAKKCSSYENIIRYKITVVQPLLSSSNGQWGVHSLAEDSVELFSLMNNLQSIHPRKIILIGHSTGCQNILNFAQSCSGSSTQYCVVAAILQSPIPDRMYLSSAYPDEWQDMAAWAQSHKDDDMYPLMVCGVPINAYRLRSVLLPGGDDDYFSLDMSQQDRQTRFSGINSLSIPLFVQWSGEEEYMGIKGEELRGWYEASGTAIKQACESAQIWDILPKANHAISDVDSQDVFLERVMSVVSSVVLQQS